MSSSAINEVVPKAGLLFQEIDLQPVLCKAKIMPLKSVTLERLEKMQKQAQEKGMELEKQQQQQTLDQRPKTAIAEESGDRDDVGSSRNLQPDSATKADVWRAEDEDPSTAPDDSVV